MTAMRVLPSYSYRICFWDHEVNGEQVPSELIYAALPADARGLPVSAGRFVAPWDITTPSDQLVAPS